MILRRIISKGPIQNKLSPKWHTYDNDDKLIAIYEAAYVERQCGAWFQCMYYL